MVSPAEQARNKQQVKYRPPTAYGQKRTPETMAKVIEGLAKGWSVGKSAEAAGITRTTAFDWRRDDEGFAAAWADAVERGVDLLEDEAFRRGVDGVDKPLTYQGEIFSTVKEYSDPLLLAQLRGKRRSVYGDRQVIEGGDKPLEVTVSARDLLAERIAGLAKRSKPE